MKIRIAMFFLLLISVITSGVAKPAADTISDTTLTLTFFGSNTCHECMLIKEQLLLPLANKHPEKLFVRYFDIEDETGIKELIHLKQKRGITEEDAQMLFFPDTFLSGYEDIMRLGKTMIEQRLTKVPVTAIDTGFSSVDLVKILKEMIGDPTFFFGTFAAGLADGVNPCAIATMIFLISFLATRKRKRSEILLIGITYTVTVFITYLAMGLGLKGVFEHIKGYHLISQIVRWAACMAAAVIAVLSFKDAYSYHKTGKTEEITLQLPKVVKVKIHKIISGNLSGRSLLIGSVITGFLVTLLEAICTGQMYIPYIVAMTQHSSLRIAGYLYLIFYNFLFVLPLLIVMVLAYFGLKWTDLAKQTQRRMVLLKILLGCIMVGLAVYLAVGSGFIGK